MSDTVSLKKKVDEDVDFGSNSKVAQKFDVAVKEVPEFRPDGQVKPTDVNMVFSPLVRDDPNDGLRGRKNWHQTWKRSDEFDAAIDMGYRQIRKQKKGEHAKPGFESGEVLTRTDDDCTIIAMEIPEWVYQDHLLALSVKSHRSYNDPDEVMKQFSMNSGRDLSSKKEQISLAVDYEKQTEVLKR